MSLLKMIKKILTYPYKIAERRNYIKRGYSSYYVNFWKPEMERNYKTCDLPKSQVRWAKEKGFNPYRILQYGLTDENYKEVISDRDYFYLFPLNNVYARWIDDKLTLRYILEPFKEFMPKYYYHVLEGRGIMPLMDIPSGYGHGTRELMRLLRDKNLLAFKMTAGTYGIGFYKVEYDGTKYIVNGKEYGESDFCTFVESLSDYIVTEYVEMHPQLKAIYSGAVNTIRCTVTNEHSDDPKLQFAFMRIGTEKSGIVDNVAQGGMVCKVDKETGRYYDAQMLKNHVYFDVKNHPDTNVLVEGVLPNWELVKTKLIEIGNYWPQLKWLGYDIAITKDGFKIIEVNSHHGLHKAHEYPQELKDFLFAELKKKKEKYNYNV